jgi:ppGpp synthetase/RelA/SpoT-type nucleotidyltranferase
MTETDRAAELGIIEEFRGAHAEPLTRVAADLRHLVADVSGGQPEVGQRLKRMATILDKLDRQPTMALSRMNDIAGCRAVVVTQVTVDTLIDRLRAENPWELLPKTWDYAATPKPDGYRAKHLVAVADGLRVEIQLRTAGQHAWAELVESTDRELGSRAKFGGATPELASALADAAETVARYERREVDLAAMITALALVQLQARWPR